MVADQDVLETMATSVLNRKSNTVGGGGGGLFHMIPLLILLNTQHQCNYARRLERVLQHMCLQKLCKYRELLYTTVVDTGLNVFMS